MSTSVDAPITDVTVYRRYARVTRRGKIQLEAGEQTLIVSPVTSNIEADSVRAGGRGAGITIRSVDVKTDRVVQNPQKQIEDLKHQKQTLTQSIIQLKDEATSLKKKIALLENFGEESGITFARAIARGRTPLKTVTETMDYVTKQTDAIRSQLRENDLKQTDLALQVEALDKKLDYLGNWNTTIIHEIHMIVDVQADVEFEFEVSYTAQGAKWTPIYDLRLIDNDVTLTYLASVDQKTGEAWDNVELSLSTARPAGSTQLPEVEPWYIQSPAQYYVQPQRRGKSESRFGANMPASIDNLSLSLDEAAPSAPQSAAPAPIAPPATTTVNTESATSVTYKIAGTVDIGGDGTSHQTTVVVTGLDVELDYFTAPRLGTDCYLRATITNTSDYTLLPGTASIFHEGDFVGKTSIETIAPDEEFEVQLGVDDRIRVERKLVKRDISKKLLGSNKKSTYEFTITIGNYLGKPAKVKIVEPYPKSTSADIKVAIVSVSPQPDEESDLNILTWETELESQQEIQLKLSFAVESSSDWIHHLIN